MVEHPMDLETDPSRSKVPPLGNQVLEKMRRDAAAIFKAGVGAVDAGTAVERHVSRQGTVLRLGRLTVDLSTVGDIYVVGAGKAVAPMAQAIEALLGDRIKAGLVCVKYDHEAPLDRIRLVSANHPVPDENGSRAAREILALVSGKEEQDLVICLLSGGASALMALPAPGISLGDKQETTACLLACGADIQEINTIRKHLSAIKGGQLARAAFPARVVSLALSDVIGDVVSDIASGPTAADPGTFQDCMRIIHRYQLADRLPPAVMTRMKKGAAGEIRETPKPGDALFTSAAHVIVGSNAAALSAAAEEAKNLGYTPLILSSMIEGETRQVARMHTAIAREVLKSAHPVAAPACLLSGGETTVTLQGRGKGGRNQEFTLAAVPEIAGIGHIVVLSAGTDGSDGPTDAAGALADSLSLERARQLGLDPHGALAENDSYPFFKALQDLVVTGPTRTNVMDLRILLVTEASPELLGV
jgi:hydroxypyruvate reductase